MPQNAVTWIGNTSDRVIFKLTMRFKLHLSRLLGNFTKPFLTQNYLRRGVHLPSRRVANSTVPWLPIPLFPFWLFHFCFLVFLFGLVFCFSSRDRFFLFNRFLMNDYRFGFEQQQQKQQQLFHLKQKPFDQFCSLMLATLVNKKMGRWWSPQESFPWLRPPVSSSVI